MSMGEHTATLTAEDLRAVASDCLQSSTNNGAEGAIFYVMSIVLGGLAKRLEDKATDTGRT